ncbi:Quinohemoprotein alcohol dehydrogenase ADH-IIG [Ensifer psoraleae]|uniref:cytochrome c-550 PedF n=1 Tax=Sinorhizobium TaxID=28105 RepID=UPI001569C06A|nr:MULTISPECIES: cytochrome c-550 PedF [Sinorhizobium]MDK1385695.1 cytochrome c-550 PedF [Sinorhizobium sp. 7-81]NRP72815.1 Quinohemoprotein alcohol dehydrogenase ADH-IIG [Sinorhizobium psoraleae]
MSRNRIRAGLAGFALLATATMVVAHGDVAPQPVNTDALPEIGEEWLTENPYREAKAGHDVWLKAVEVGASGFNQNCARCHGLGAVSGGLAPDLRFLEAEEYGDEWFIERFRHGYTQDGTTKMPAFGDILGQKAAWAIRTYIETRPADGALDAHSDRLHEVRNELASTKVEDPKALKSELEKIAAEVETASGAPVADSVAYEAARVLGETPESWKKASEILTVGLSATE